jgi:hypothetical protein
LVSTCQGCIRRPQFLVGPHPSRVHGDEPEEQDDRQGGARGQRQRLPFAIRPPKLFDEEEKVYRFSHR